MHKYRMHKRRKAKEEMAMRGESDLETPPEPELAHTSSPVEVEIEQAEKNENKMF